ncbi:E3 ubiquitin-protein ligase SDIR1, partial [Cucurbita argyrosperma subsp. argyrosperma]
PSLEETGHNKQLNTSESPPAIDSLPHLLRRYRRVIILHVSDFSHQGLICDLTVFLVLMGCPAVTSTSDMSFVFRGTRVPDIENGLPGFIPERRAMRVHAARPVNSNSLAFLVTVLLLFMILNSHQMSPNFLAQAQARAMAASGLLGHTELRLHMPPSIALATRGHYETLRALDSDNVPTTPSMSEEQINALPVHKYKVSGPQRRDKIQPVQLAVPSPYRMNLHAVFA